MKSTMHRFLGLALGAISLGACAVEPPVELTSARVELDQASGSEAAAESPADLQQARIAIREADACVDRSCDPDVARDLAYVASRRVLRAQTAAQIAEQVRVQQDAYRRHQEAASRARLPAPESTGGVAQSRDGGPAPVMVR
jgi:hypothetical protein